MRVLLPFLSVLLLVSWSESRTAKNRRNLPDDDEEFKVIEQAVYPESVVESDKRTTSEMVNGQVDFDLEYPYDTHLEIAQNLREEEAASRPILEGLDSLRKSGGGRRHAHPRYDLEGKGEIKNYLNDFESQHPRRFDSGGLMEVAQLELGATKTYVCDNLLEIYRTILVKVNETAILYSPLFLQRREYPNNSNCGWRFETSAQHRLSFNCSEFDVREGDYLSLKDDKSSELERFSGGRRLNHITKMNTTFVVFYSNDKESGRGFNCTVTSVTKSGSVDAWQAEVKPTLGSEIGLASKQSLVAKLCENCAVNSKLPAVELRVSSPVRHISEEVLETIEIRNDIESLTDRSDSFLNKSTVEKVNFGGSSADEDRLTYLKIGTTSSSMHAVVYSSKVMQTVVDPMGNVSLATRTLLNSTRVIGITTNVVEKREGGGGALFAESYVYNPTRSNLPGHTTTSVLKSNMSSASTDKFEFVRDDLTGERHQENTSFIVKASSESTEIKSSIIDFPEEFAEPTPPL